MDDVWRSVALACGLLAVTIAGAAHRAARPALVVGTIVQLEHGRMLLDVEYADPPSPRRVEVAYRGPLPLSVCRDYEVAVTGAADGATLAAYEVAPVNTGRYDPCFAWRCFPELCRRRFE